MMTTTLDGCWQGRDNDPHNDVAHEERVWLKELNQAVFSGLEKKLAGRVKVYPVNTPAFLCVTPGDKSHASYVMTERVCLPDAPFEAQVVAAVERPDARQCSRFEHDVSN